MWDNTVVFAAALAEAGADDDAAELLAGPLSALDPVTTGPDHLVIATAMLYARVVEPVPGLAPDEVAWARYSHRAARTMHGPDHPSTIEAIQTLAGLLSRSRYAEASGLPETYPLHPTWRIDAHLSFRIDLAVQLHDLGRCDDAVEDQRQVHLPYSGCGSPLALGTASCRVKETHHRPPCQE